ncbi:MAG: RAMP superfamily CRISPR-associated protein [bacterium]
MHRIRYQIKTLSPILLSANTGDQNMTATSDYIPGSALLGIFAGKYIQVKNLGDIAHEDPDFYNSFLNSGIIFCNAYPCKKSKKYLPVPLSIQTEKNDETKATDLLYNDSEEQMKTIGGYCYITGDIIQRLTPSKSLNFHHARPDRIKGHSTEGLIFNYESIDPDQLFEGEIIGEKETLKELVGLVGDKFFIRLGRSRTAQYGQAEMELLSKQPEEIEIENELDKEFILTLRSPAIFYNKNGFPSTSLKVFETYLAETLGIMSDRIQITKSFTKPVEIENFISVWRLKKPSETAFQSGSCFSVQVIGWNGSVESKLKDLQKNGIGERRGEGFGRIVLNWHEKDSYTVKSINEEKPEKPAGKMPELTVNIFKEVIKENRRKSIERKALQEYDQFTKHNPPTNSLLGRLEMMLMNAEDMEQFLGQMSDLRKTARENLERCKGEMVTLLEFIESGKPDFQQVFKQEPELTKMEQAIEYSPSADTEFCKELYRLYWLTFLRMMHKSRKKEGVNEQN